MSITIRELYKAFELLSLECPDKETERELERLWMSYATKYEELPINEEESVRFPMMYILMGGEWVGVSAYEETTAYPGCTPETPYIRYTTGSLGDDCRVTGLAAFGSWAHCCASNTPSLPDPNWKWPESYPETEEVVEDQSE